MVKLTDQAQQQPSMAASMQDQRQAFSRLQVRQHASLQSDRAQQLTPQGVALPTSTPAPGLAAADARIWEMMPAGGGGGLGIIGRGGPPIMGGNMPVRGACDGDASVAMAIRCRCDHALAQRWRCTH